MPRKKPFSNKQKKVQILHKREKKRDKLESDSVEASQLVEGEGEVCDGPIVVDKVHEQPLRVGETHDPNRYRLHFERESRAEIERRKLLAKREVIIPVGEESLEVGVEGVYRPGSVLDIPRRPSWNYSMSKAEVEGQEEVMFEGYLREIYSNHKTENLSYFEHNLETWRQLWRVVEISDVILFITDARHPALHFSPALYNYVVKDLKKQLVLILNKIDLVPPQVAVAWRHYFLNKFPQLNVICFTSYPNKDISTQPSKKVHLKFRRSGRNLPSAVGPQELLSVLEGMYRGRVDTAGWRAQASPTSTPDNGPCTILPGNGPRTITPDNGPRTILPGNGPRTILPGNGPRTILPGNGPCTILPGNGPCTTTPDNSSRTITPDNGTSSNSESESGDPEIAMVTMSSNPLERDSVSAGVLTLGLVGHPNVGKSSIINGLLRRKAVSTSRTPGHTKHFQTVFLSPSLRLCDCPGLVFPSLVNRQLQVLSGIYPVAQVREPYTAVGYITARLPIVELLALQHPNTVATVAKKTKGRRTGDFELDDSIHVSHVSISDCHVMSAEPQQWTAWEVCDAWADKRGYITARGARLDTYRAANSLLRLVVDGRICLYFVPPGYTKEKDYWVGHSEVAEMLALQSEGMSCSRTEVISSEEEEEAQEETIKTLNKFASLANIDD